MRVKWLHNPEQLSLPGFDGTHRCKSPPQLLTSRAKMHRPCIQRCASTAEAHATTAALRGSAETAQATPCNAMRSNAGALRAARPTRAGAPWRVCLGAAPRLLRLPVVGRRHAAAAGQPGLPGAIRSRGESVESVWLARAVSRGQFLQAPLKRIAARLRLARVRVSTSQRRSRPEWVWEAAD